MCRTLCQGLIEAAYLLGAHTVISVHCSTDVQRHLPHSIKAQVLLLAAKDRSHLPHLCPLLASLLTSLLMSLETQTHSWLWPCCLECSSPWSPNDWLTKSLWGILCGSSSNRAFLGHPSNAAIPTSFFAPFCFISLLSTLHYLTRVICNLFILLIL